MNADQLDSLTERVLGVFEVTNTLGARLLEKVYQRALLRELGLRGIRATAPWCVPNIHRFKKPGNIAHHRHRLGCLRAAAPQTPGKSARHKARPPFANPQPPLCT